MADHPAKLAGKMLNQQLATVLVTDTWLDKTSRLSHRIKALGVIEILIQ